jgi:hypothetical protein
VMTVQYPATDATAIDQTIADASARKPRANWRCRARRASRRRELRDQVRTGRGGSDDYD